MKNNGVSKGIRNSIWFKTFGPSKHGKCHYCQRVLAFKNSTLDHVIPVSVTRKPRDVKNLVISCRECNEKKGIKTVDEFRQLAASLDEGKP